MGILLWLVFGALVGWAASLIMRTDENQGAIANVAVGIIGAFIGGFIAEFLGWSGITGFNLGSFLIALTGAIVLVGALQMVRSGRG